MWTFILYCRCLNVRILRRRTSGGNDARPRGGEIGEELDVVAGIFTAKETFAVEKLPFYSWFSCQDQEYHCVEN